MQSGPQNENGLIEPPGQNKPRLFIYEWAAILCILGFFAMICTLTQGSYRLAGQMSPDNEIHQETISIKIEGAVENPGIFFVSRKSTVEEALRLAKPTQFADLKKIVPGAAVKSGQRIKVPSIPLITVHIKGEVDSAGFHQMRKGTRLCDLPALLQFPESVDLSKFKKKRALKNGEVIEVPSVSS